MDPISVLFGLYFDSIWKGIKWCFSGGRFFKACLFYFAMCLFWYFTFTSHYKGKIEREEKERLALYNKMLEERRQADLKRSAELLKEVDRVLGRPSK